MTGVDLYPRRPLLPIPIGRHVRPFDVTSLKNLHTNYTELAARVGDIAP